METVRYLIEERGADAHIANKSGTSALILACGNVDADPQVVRYLLERCGIDANRRIVSQTSKWKLLRSVARLALRSKLSRSKLMKRIAESGGLTALHYAARRGDVEIVEILMEYGADPTLKNDLGRDVMSYCEAFPGIRVAIQRVQRNGVVRIEPSSLATQNSGARRLVHLERTHSTVVEVKYGMYLLSLAKFQKLFGEKTSRTRNINLCHQDLLRRKELIRFEDLPMSAFTIFVSHEWLSREHPDPHGIQVRTLCSLLRNLRDGTIEKVCMDTIHRLTYKENFTTKTREWKHILSNAYLWFDFWSQPQPSFEIEETPSRRQAEVELSRALESIPAYVERCDIMFVLTPMSQHKQRICATTRRREFNSYRTWRKRGFCVLEFFSSFLSRYRYFPVLLCESEETLRWISPVEAQKLSIGMSTFSCCEINHSNGRRCDKFACENIMDLLVNRMSQHMFDHVDSTLGRGFYCSKTWWLRHLPSDLREDSSSLSEFKTRLRWKSSNTYWDKNNVTILMLATMSCNVLVVKEIVTLLENEDIETRSSVLETRIRRKGYVMLGIPGGCTALFAAMAWGNTEIISLLLSVGADYKALDHNAADSVMYAAYYGRAKNIKYWMKRFPEWDLNRCNKVTGANALLVAMSQGIIVFHF